MSNLLERIAIIFHKLFGLSPWGFRQFIVLLTTNKYSTISQSIIFTKYWTRKLFTIADIYYNRRQVYMQQIKYR